MDGGRMCTGRPLAVPPRSGADGLGLLVLVVAVLALQLLDLGDVALLCLLGRDALLGHLLPGVVLGLALFSRGWGRRRCPLSSVTR